MKLKVRWVEVDVTRSTLPLSTEVMPCCKRPNKPANERTKRVFRLWPFSMNFSMVFHQRQFKQIPFQSHTTELQIKMTSRHTHTPRILLSLRSRSLHFYTIWFCFYLSVPPFPSSSHSSLDEEICRDDDQIDSLFRLFCCNKSWLIHDAKNSKILTWQRMNGKMCAERNRW